MCKLKLLRIVLGTQVQINVNTLLLLSPSLYQVFLSTPRTEQGGTSSLDVHLGKWTKNAIVCLPFSEGAAHV